MYMVHSDLKHLFLSADDVSVVGEFALESCHIQTFSSLCLFPFLLCCTPMRGSD